MTYLPQSSASPLLPPQALGGGAASAPREQPVTSALEAIGQAARSEATPPSLEGRVSTAVPAEAAPPYSPEKVNLLAAVRVDGFALFNASLELRNDRDIVLAAVRLYGEALQYASLELRNDRDIVLAAVTQSGLALPYASQELRNHRDIVLAAVRQCGEALQFAGEALQNNPAIVRAAVTQSGSALRYAGYELQNDHDIVLAAVRQYGIALHNASPELQNDRAIVLAAVTKNGVALQFASVELRNDPDIVLAAVRQYGVALEVASPELQNDPGIVLAAVTQNGSALRSAGYALQNDPGIVLAAVTQNAWALHFASTELRNDPRFLLAAAEKNGLVLDQIPEPLRTLEVCSAAVAQNVEAISRVPRALIEEARSQMDNPSYFPLLPTEEQTPERARGAVEHNPLSLGCINATVVDKGILIAALRRKPEALNLIDPDLLTDTLVNALVYNSDSLTPNNAVTDTNEARKSALKKLADLAMKAKTYNPDIIYLLAQYFNDDREFMIFAIAKCGVDFTIASERLRGDPSVTSEILNINPAARDGVLEM